MFGIFDVLKINNVVSTSFDHNVPTELKLAFVAGKIGNEIEANL